MKKIFKDFRWRSSITSYFPQSKAMRKALKDDTYRLECLGLSVRADTETGQGSRVLLSLSHPLDRGVLALYVDRNGKITASTAWINGQRLRKDIEWVFSPEFDEIIRDLPKAGEIRLRKLRKSKARDMFARH